MTAAAFRAAYSEWKVIKTRATVQLVFEIPIELADQAYQALGGMPIAAKEVWCGIARIDPKAVQRPAVSQAAAEAPRPELQAPNPAGAAKERNRLAQQAGILCNERLFRLFLAEKFEMPIPDPEGAKQIIYEHCNVTSRKDLTPENVGWSDITLAYALWKRAPEVVPA